MSFEYNAPIYKKRSTNSWSSYVPSTLRLELLHHLETSKRQTSMCANYDSISALINNIHIKLKYCMRTTRKYSNMFGKLNKIFLFGSIWKLVCTQFFYLRKGNVEMILWESCKVIVKKNSKSKHLFAYEETHTVKRHILLNYPLEKTDEVCDTALLDFYLTLFFI